MKWISRQNRNYWFWFCVLTWFQILGTVLSEWISCPLLAAFSGFPTWGSWPGIPCRRSFGFQGSIGVLLVTYHTFKRFFRTWQVRFWGSKPDIVGPVRWTALNRAYHNNTRIFRKWYFRFLPSKPEVIVPVWCNIEWINADFYKTLFLRKFTYSAPVKVRNWRILVLNIGFGRSTTSVFEFEFEKIGFKNCEVVPACPACYNCVGSESSQPVSYTDAQT